MAVVRLDRRSKTPERPSELAAGAADGAPLNPPGLPAGTHAGTPPALRLAGALPSGPGDALATRSDDDLMTLAQAGSRAAFSALIERHGLRIVQLCSRFVDDPQCGRELAQDTWVLVWRQRDKYRAGTAFGSWLITIARNRCRNHLRRRKLAAARPGVLSEHEAHHDEDQIAHLLRQERRRRVRGALGGISPPMREALLLRYAEELRYDQMTDILGVGESTLRSRVHHGLRILKQKLENDS